MKYIALLSLAVLFSCSKYELTDVSLEEDPAATLSAYFIVGTTPQLTVFQTSLRNATSQVEMKITNINLYRNDSLIVHDESGSLKDYPEATINYGQNYRIEVTTSDGTQLSGNISTARQLKIERISRDTIQEKDGSSSIVYKYFLDMNNPQVDQLPVSYNGGFIDSSFRHIDSSYVSRTYDWHWTGVIPDPRFNLKNNRLAFLNGNFKDTLVFKAPSRSFIGHNPKNAVHTLFVMSPILITQYNLTKNIDYGFEEYYHVPVMPTNVEGGVGIITEFTSYILQ